MKEEKPFFSIIIPLYNKETYLSKTLNSVLAQTFVDFEVVIVNDGSTDGSAALAGTFAQADGRIKVFSKPNGGVSSARNFGISLARADYVAFLDADDFWEPRFLEEMCYLITGYPACGMWGCAYKTIKRNKELLNCTHLPEGIIDNYFQRILKDRISWTSATVIRREVFDRLGGFPEGMIGGEDYYMWSKVAIHYKMAFTPKVLASYNLSDGALAGRIGHQDTCKESWYELCGENDFYRNEFIAKKAIENGIRHAWGCHKAKSREIESQFQYTTLFKERWKRLFILNRLPSAIIHYLLFIKKIKTYYYMNFSAKF
jgi:glycosyltransferase involved in cell wall biosynthesis